MDYKKIPQHRSLCNNKIHHWLKYSNKTFLKRSADLMLTISLGTPVSLSLVNRLASLLFSSSGKTASKEDDVGLSFLFGGIKLQGLTRQMAEHQKNSPYTLTIPSLPQNLCGGVFEQLARYTMRYQESDLHLAFILLNLLTTSTYSATFSVLPTSPLISTSPTN